jgi:hypothetical protein
VNNQKQATSNIGKLLKEKMMDSQPQVLLDSQESESDTQTGPADNSSAKPQSEETNSV